MERIDSRCLELNRFLGLCREDFSGWSCIAFLPLLDIKETPFTRL